MTSLEADKAAAAQAIADAEAILRDRFGDVGPFFGKSCVQGQSKSRSTKNRHPIESASSSSNVPAQALEAEAQTGEAEAQAPEAEAQTGDAEEPFLDDGGIESGYFLENGLNELQKRKNESSSGSIDDSGSSTKRSADMMEIPDELVPAASNLRQRLKSNTDHASLTTICSTPAVAASSLATLQRASEKNRQQRGNHVGDSVSISAAELRSQMTLPVVDEPYMIPFKNLDTGEVKILEANAINAAAATVNEFLDIFTGKVDLTKMLENNHLQDGSLAASDAECSDSGNEGDVSAAYIPEGPPSSGFRAMFARSTTRRNSATTLGGESSRLARFSRRFSLRGENRFFRTASGRRASSPQLSTKNASASTAVVSATSGNIGSVTVPFRLTTSVAQTKSEAFLSDVWCVAELKTTGPLWTLDISDNGRWMAAGTQSGEMLVWTFADSDTETTSPTAVAPVLFGERPTYTLRGHTLSIVVAKFESSGTIISGRRERTLKLSSTQSKAARLASASLDHTIRIWTLALNEEPTSFAIQSSEWVTSIRFHPTRRDLLYGATVDGTLQLWRLPVSIERGSTAGSGPVAASFPAAPAAFHGHSHPRFKQTELLDFQHLDRCITTMSVSPDGTLLAVGFSQGVVKIYDAQGLRFRGQIECRNRRGRFASGRKVTGLAWSSTAQFLAISTSDSRIRVVELEDITRWWKFKGHRALQVMVHAEFSPSERHLICPSENGFIYLWNFPFSEVTAPGTAGNAIKNYKGNPLTTKSQRPTNAVYEKFRAFDSLITSGCVAPPKFAAAVLGTLLSKTTAAVSQSWRTLQEKLQEQNQAAGIVLDGSDQDGSTAAVQGLTSVYGLVIVATSYQGSIRVFINAAPPLALGKNGS